MHRRGSGVSFDVVSAVLDFEARNRMDEDGRPCGEVGSDRYGEVATDVVACPYTGARKGGAMNASAWRQMGTCWKKVLSDWRVDVGPRPDLWRVWEVAIAGVVSPCRHVEPVPRDVAVRFKASLGIGQVLTAVLLEEDGAGAARFADVATPKAWLDWLELDRWLVGEVQVCAGSPGAIAEVLGALGEGSDGASVDDRGDVAIVPRAVALMVAEELAGRGRWPQAPWLRGVRFRPGRRPAHARRLLRSEDSALETLLAARDPVDGWEAAVALLRADALT